MYNMKECVNFLFIICNINVYINKFKKWSRDVYIKNKNVPCKAFFDFLLTFTVSDETRRNVKMSWDLCVSLNYKMLIINKHIREDYETSWLKELTRTIVYKNIIIK